MVAVSLRGRRSFGLASGPVALNIFSCKIYALRLSRASRRLRHIRLVSVASSGGGSVNFCKSLYALFRRLGLNTECQKSKESAHGATSGSVICTEYCLESKIDEGSLMEDLTLLSTFLVPLTSCHFEI